jgi:putative hemolysin
MRTTEEQPSVELVTPAKRGVVEGTRPAKHLSTRPSLDCGPYQLRFAESREDREAAFRLRFLVFNLELGEGLESAYENGHDCDQFDAICDHLIVEHSGTGQIVGTYRLQTGQVAAENRGYYSAREFDFSPYESIRDSLVELGRASIHRDHRSFEVLTLLWRGVAFCAQQENARFLVGCSSLTSQNLQEGSDVYRVLQDFLVEPALRTVPRDQFRFPLATPSSAAVSVHPPRLLRAYLSIGAKICGPPALDREFKTIDFLTLLDLEQLSEAARVRFFGQMCLETT